MQAATQYATIGMGLFFLVQYTSFSDEVFKQHAARVGAIQKALLQGKRLPPTPSPIVKYPPWLFPSSSCPFLILFYLPIVRGS